MFITHGALFLDLKTSDPVRARAQRVSSVAGVVAVVAGGGFLAWTEASYRRGGWNGTGIASVALAALAAAALIGMLLAIRLRRGGLSFAASALGIAAAVGALFTALYPDVLPSSINPAYSLTTANAASADPTLRIMTVVAVIFLPLVIAYQAWTYWVFRKRVIVPPQAASPDTGRPPKVPQT